MRCAAKGAERCVGIDLSPEAINKAKNLAKSNDVGDKTDMLVGGIVDLESYDDNEFDTGILSNIVDNLIPEDGDKLLKEFKRIIKPDGKIFLKLNDYIEPALMEDRNAQKISENLYREEDGIYLWNLKDEEVRNILEEYFIIEKRVDVKFSEEGQTNRLYYLRNG